jgi:Xaa-Pro aminopeptidase
MRSAGFDHLLLTGFDSIRYAIDARFHMICEGGDWFTALVDLTGGAEVFVPWSDEEHIGPDPDVSAIQRTHPLPSWIAPLAQGAFWSDSVAAALSRVAAKRVGFDLLDASLLDGLRDRVPHIQFTSVGRLLYELRAVKTPEEIGLLRAAAVVNSAAIEHAIAQAGVGMTDFEVLATAMNFLQAAGVEFLTHSLCNTKTGTGWFASGQTLREGDAFFLDIGCYGRGGYASDMARTGFVGEPPAPVSNAYRLLLEAHHVGENEARPGRKVADVHAAVNRTLQALGLPATPYGIGHGVGLRACELPTIGRSDRSSFEEVLTEGMTISLEPQTQVDVGGTPVIVKLEDNYAVESGGLRRLTGEPRAHPYTTPV